MIPVANTTILLHLLALGYVPVVFAPAVDAAGGAIDLETAALAAFVAQFIGAALLLLSPGESAPATSPGLPPVPPIVVTSPGRLLMEMLQHAPNLPVAAPGQTPISTGSSVMTGSAILSKTPAPR
jgi:hypothetical protein